MTRPICSLLYIVLAIQLTGCSPTPGQRLILTKIELNGQAILQGVIATPDYCNKHQTIDMLSIIAFEPVGEWKPPAPLSKEQPESEEPQSVELHGKIRVVLLHADQTYGEASFKDLRVYYFREKNEYQLLGSDVVKIKQAIK